jgi:hypothetical protein
MSFFSRGSKENNKGNRGGRGKRPNMFWQDERNKKIKFSIHFYVDSEEFNHLVQTGPLNLGGKLTLPQPFSPPNAPFQPHPHIMDVLESPLQPMDDGWKNNHVNPPSGVSHWFC